MKLIRSAFGLLLGLTLVATSAALVEAHMTVEKSEPATDAVLTAPVPHVQVFFSEAPDLKVSKIEIKGPSDKTKLMGMHAMGKSLMAMVEGDMPDGMYTVSWQSAGDDGHVQKGEFMFTVKRK